MQIMNAVWVEDVWSALNLVQYNEKVFEFCFEVSCLYYPSACCEIVLNV